MQNFSITDCWVLFSIGFGEKGSTLKEVISAGDMLNHAIVTKDELETSLNKLIYNDYISFENDKYFATEIAKRFYEKNRRSSEGCIAEWIRIADLFKEQPVKPGQPKLIKITDEDYKKALNSVYRDFKKNLNKLNILPVKTRMSLFFWTMKKIKETKR